MTIKTELKWLYQPVDFFEAPYEASLANGEFRADAGSAVYILATPTEPVEAALREAITEEVLVIFELRQLLTHRAFTLQVLTIVQHNPDGKKDIAISVGLKPVLITDRVDFILTDSTGSVVSDTKAERIASETAFIASLIPKLAKSTTLRAMVKSYGQAVHDPDDELVHLYEVRDAATKYYGNESAVRSAIGITKADWQKLGRLANDEPLRQARHRGKRPMGLRDATPQELKEARTIAKQIIEAFAAKV